MKTAKTFALVSATFVLAVVSFTVVAPKTAHAIVATLVQVTNTSANPVPTQAVGTTPVSGTVGIDPAANTVQLANTPALQPFTFVYQTSFNSGGENAKCSFTVPHGKRLIVEEASADAEVSTPGAGISQVISATVSAKSAGNYVPAYFVLSDIGPAGRFEFYAGSARPRLYADSDTLVVLTVHRPTTDTDGNAASCYVSGYLVEQQ
jgi:hypothetical protein